MVVLQDDQKGEGGDFSPEKNRINPPAGTANPPEPPPELPDVRTDGIGSMFILFGFLRVAIFRIESD